jgi:protein O-mannosyl-transferase
MGLALMSKSMAASLPFALMLCDYWPLRRAISVSASIREKLPLFGLAVASGIVTIVTSRRGGAGIEVFPFALRVENGLIRYVLYLVKMFWPANMAAFYPYPLAIPVWQAILAALTLCGLTALFVMLRRYRYLPVGWLWYLVTMSLVIGIVQSGWQAWADRYMYIPMIGLSAMIAWGAADLLCRWPQCKGYMVALAGASCLLMTAVTYNQIQYWKNTETLFVHALAVTDRNVMAHNSLGAYFLDMPGRLPEAIDHLEKAIAIDPKNEIAHNSLGLALLKVPGRLADARTHFETAVRLRPSYIEAHNNLAAAFLRTPGGALNAVNEFETAVRIKPDSEEAHYNLGAALSTIPGRLSDAITQFEAAVQISPDFDGRYALGMTLAQVPERRAEAVVHLRAALQLRPESREAQQLLRQLTGSGVPSN